MPTFLVLEHPLPSLLSGAPQQNLDGYSLNIYKKTGSLPLNYEKYESGSFMNRKFMKMQVADHSNTKHSNVTRLLLACLMTSQNVNKSERG